MAVAEGDDLVAFQLLVSVEADAVATLLGRRRRAITVEDRDIKQIVLVKLHHRAGENSIDAAIGLPSPEGTINAGGVDFRTAVVIPVDWQLLPLTPQIQQFQNVVEDLEQTRLRCWSTAAGRKVRQDKLFKHPEIQLCGNRLPTTASSHSSPPENWILPDPGTAAENPASRRLPGKFGGPENP